jgi:type IV pilus assembly protein PilM
MARMAGRHFMAYEVLNQKEGNMLFRRNKQSKRDVAIGLDLGTSQIKAAVLRRIDSGFQLADYAVVPTSGGVGKSGTKDKFAEELQQVMAKLGTPERRVRVAISCSSAMVCETEFPRMPIEEVKSALKLNSTRYLRRDFSNYYLDAVELTEPPKDEKAKQSSTIRILVGGANREEVLWYRDALTTAKIRPETMELAAVSVVNAFRFMNPELCEKEVVLLVDIGGRSTTINLLRHGQPLMTRIMHFGGQQISEYLGQMLAVQTAAAEQEKLKMSESALPFIKQAIFPLAKEVRSSIDFFERQQECHVTRAFACGGSACGPAVLQSLSEQVGCHLECWNPVQTLSTSHFNGDGPKLLELAPSLAVALGAAATQV